jgi:hypothetical protein
MPELTTTLTEGTWAVIRTMAALRGKTPAALAAELLNVYADGVLRGYSDDEEDEPDGLEAQ